MNNITYFYNFILRSRLKKFVNISNKLWNVCWSLVIYWKVKWRVWVTYTDFVFVLSNNYIFFPSQALIIFQIQTILTAYFGNFNCIFYFLKAGGGGGYHSIKCGYILHTSILRLFFLFIIYSTNYSLNIILI